MTAALDNDIVSEARRLVALGAGSGVTARLLGGTAIALRAQPPAALRRAIKDIDIAIGSRTQEAFGRALTAAGYSPSERFNAVRGDRRMLFFDEENERQVDVFVGEFAMCHRLNVSARLAVDDETLPLAELLLTKLQTVELNPKDLTDAYALLRAFAVADRDGDAINAAVIASVCGGNWGWQHTVELNLGRAEQRLGGVGLSPPDEVVIASRIDALRACIEKAPKSARWRLRARIGERRRWYDEPEEVQ